MANVAGRLVGNAGEYFVMAELLRRGVIVGLTPRNAPEFDILATRGERAVRIRVKTRNAAKSNSWQYSVRVPAQLKNKEIPLEQCKQIAKELSPFNQIDADDFTVLVALRGPTERPDFFVVPTRKVEEWLQEGFAKWIETPGRKGKQRNPANWERRLGPEYACKYEPYRDDWDRLWGELPQKRTGGS